MSKLPKSSSTDAHLVVVSVRRLHWYTLVALILGVGAASMASASGPPSLDFGGVTVSVGATETEVRQALVSKGFVVSCGELDADTCFIERKLDGKRHFVGDYSLRNGVVIRATLKLSSQTQGASQTEFAAALIGILSKMTNDELRETWLKTSLGSHSGEVRNMYLRVGDKTLSVAVLTGLSAGGAELPPSVDMEMSVGGK